MSFQLPPMAPLPKQAGWAVEMHGTAVLFASNAEKAAGASPGATTPVFTADQLKAAITADRRAVIEAIAEYAYAMARDCNRNVPAGFPLIDLANELRAAATEKS